MLQPALARLLAEVDPAGALELGETQAGLGGRAAFPAFHAHDEQASAPPDVLRAEIDDGVHQARMVERGRHGVAHQAVAAPLAGPEVAQAAEDPMLLRRVARPLERGEGTRPRRRRSDVDAVPLLAAKIHPRIELIVEAHHGRPEATLEHAADRFQPSGGAGKLEATQDPRLGHRLDAQACRRDDAERPLAADDELGPVRPGLRASGAPGLDDVAAAGDRGEPPSSCPRSCRTSSTSDPPTVPRASRPAWSNRSTTENARASAPCG